MATAKTKLEDGGGHSRRETHFLPASADDTPSVAGHSTLDAHMANARDVEDSGGHSARDNLLGHASADDISRGGGPPRGDTLGPTVPAPHDKEPQAGHVAHDTHITSVCLSLRELQAQRVATIRAQIRLQNQARAFVRRYLGWAPDLSEAERKKINGEAAKLVKEIEADPKHPHPATLFVMATGAGRKPLDDYRRRLEKQMEGHVKSLPVWPWCEAIKGFGALGLAIIVGEAGDLSNYPNPGKLWKRMGLAPPEAYAMMTRAGVTAKCIPKRRRSTIWTIGDSLIKGNDDGYRQIYEERKAYEVAKHPEWDKGIDDEGKLHVKMPAHRRAQRYMEKRLLRDLWRAWRATA